MLEVVVDFSEKVALCIAASSETSKRTADLVGTLGVEAAIIVISFINQADGIVWADHGIGKKTIGI
jgi:hypothetical protein